MTYTTPSPTQIVVYTEDPLKEGIHTVTLTGTIALTDMNPNDIIENPTIEYAINVQNGCLNDVIDFTSVTFNGNAYNPGDDIVYYIEDVEQTFVPTWT